MRARSDHPIIVISKELPAPVGIVSHHSGVALFLIQTLYNTFHASHTLATSPASVANSAPASVYLVFFTFAVIKYTDIV